ncbi:MAG TPA: IS200/IS605 family transposase, partial [Halomonas sp.]|nr:IS200/IS605 family transposase [Halomonas sp.]
IEQQSRPDQGRSRAPRYPSSH